MADKQKEFERSLANSTASARQLSFALAGVHGNVGKAAHLASELAESLARASKNARIAGSAVGIGLIVAALGAVVALTVGWQEKTKEVHAQIKKLNSETEAFHARGAGKLRLEQEIQIKQSMDDELENMRKQQSIIEKMVHKFPFLQKFITDMFPLQQTAVVARMTAAMDAVRRESNRAFAETLFSRESELDILRAHRLSPDAKHSDPEAYVRAQRQQFQDMMQADIDAKKYGWSPSKQKQIEGQINDTFDEMVANIEYDHVKHLGDELGRSFAESIADGIATGISSGDFGAGFRALTGSILIGFGQMMQDIGTQSLLAANLLNGVVAALMAFDPPGAIGASLLLIAAGGVVKGLGASLGGHGGRGGAGGGYGGAGGYGSEHYGTYINRGLINPANGFLSSPGLIQPRSSAVFAPTIIGTNDARAQRDVYEMWDRARRRRGG